MQRNFFKKPIGIFVLTCLLSLIPIIGIVYKILTGEFALWYDPARDLLLGLANLQKPTLIGPTTGIPGVFYGPYWIWLLSMGEIISRNLRVVTLTVATIPYIVIFPFILTRFSKIISLQVLAILWLFFLLAFNTYFTDLWNPYLSPLLILLALYLQFSRTNKLSIKNLMITFLGGFVTGLVMNFQLSFGIGMLLGSVIYILGEAVVYLIHAKKKITLIVQRMIITALFMFGCLISFLPFLLFEIRHQFLQTKTLLDAFVHYGAVVGVKGLTKPEIVQNFFGSAANLLQMPFLFTVGIFSILSIIFVYNYRQRKEKIKEEEIKLLSLVGCIFLGVLYIYLTAKNPVWSYHFIGVEILFLLVLGILMNKQNIVKLLFGCWIIFLVGTNTVSFFSKLGDHHKMIPGTVIAQEKIVEKVQAESKNKEYTVFAYSPSIYTYEYAYLFTVMYDKDVPYRPELNPKDAALVFLIFPPNTKEIVKEDFIHFRTPSKEYATRAQWMLEDGTQILKREKIKE